VVTMHMAQWIAVSVYGAVFVATWVGFGVAAALVFLPIALFLLVVFRLNEAGEFITDLARHELRKQGARSAGSTSSWLAAGRWGSGSERGEPGQPAAPPGSGTAQEYSSTGS